MLFLFDIDGTLLRRMPPAHRAALCDAAREIYGASCTLEGMGTTAGMTDTAIARRMLLATGLPASAVDEGLPDFFRAASEAYARHVPRDLRPYQTPHASEALERLRERGASLGLVTGNIQRIAWIKLEAARLAQYFSCGAFGDEAEARDALPPLAVARARPVFGRDFTPERVYVVGDTPADIACGAAHQYQTIAVATGPVHSLDELRACRPTHLFETLAGILTLEV